MGPNADGGTTVGLKGTGLNLAAVWRMDMQHPVPKGIVLALLMTCCAGAAFATQDPPASDPEMDRQRYLDAEAERAAVRNNPDYGRYDRADLNRSREAACRRLENAPRPHWAVGGYVDMGSRQFRGVQDYRGYGVRRPPSGAHWMCADSGDMILVVPGGRIVEVVPYR